MKRYFTLLGAWTVLFPVHLLATLTVVFIQLSVKIFNMPFDVWTNLDKELNQIHIEND